MTRREFCQNNKEIAHEPLHYVMSGLDDIYLLNGFTPKKTPYGSGVTISNIDGLHQAICIALITDKKILNPTELRFLRKEMKLTQAELAQRLGLSDQQVARWEKGESEISGPAEKLVRIFYVLELIPARKRQAVLSTLNRKLKELVKSDEISSPVFQFRETESGWLKAA